MATVILGAAGAAAGAALAPGFSVLGGAITSAALGRVIGATVGAYIDSVLLGGVGNAESARSPSSLNEVTVTSSVEGTPIPRCYGRVRLGGQLIWTTNFEEVVEKSSGGGGKGLGGSGGGSGGKTHKYFANFAVAICEGVISHIGRVWADGDEIELANFTHRVYKGTETQTVDSLIEAKEGAGETPPYRGVAYIVFERMPLEAFGNRIPQLSFEVFRPLDGFEKQIKAVDLIPAATEFGYEPTETIIRDVGAGFWRQDNANTSQGGTDFAVSMDNLQDVLPNASSVNMFVTWFGDDLRCADCDIKPKVDNDDKKTEPYSWKVQGITRGAAEVVTEAFNGEYNAVAYGGTPADRSVRDAIVDLQARGLNAVITPFLLMDIPENNGLTDPYTGAGDQPAYPWRGRITVNPAPGASGTVDQTAAAKTQIDAFVGSCAVSDFAITSDNEVTYSGPSEWSYRRFILHYAHIAKAAENISGTPLDAFVIGTEQPFLSWVRDNTGAFPFVDALVALAADVKSVLPNTKITYAADWTEFPAYQTSRFGGPAGEIFFHLDKLWSDSNIDAIGIDNYWPLADWRDGDSHLDKLAGAASIYDPAYLKGNIEGGEGYDWFYASQADRDSQTRTNITDGLGKPWVFRFKDIRNWWLNQHFDRPGGIESSTATSWVPESKPFWMMELGCPAIDKGANQPNVFFDPKSSESQLPYFSDGGRDDLMQRRHLSAFLDYWDPDHADFVAAQNPESGVYSGRMVDLDRVFIYTWDARPYPAFPNLELVWSDGPNWDFGHWITGRASDAPLAETIRTIFADYGFDNFELNNITGLMQGYAITEITSLRDALQPLEVAFFFDTVEVGGTIKLTDRALASVAADVGVEDLVIDENSAAKSRFTIRRGQETELPARAKIQFTDPEDDYQKGSVEAIKLVGASERTSEANLPIVMNTSIARNIADKILQEQWASREVLKISLPPSSLRVTPGDIVRLDTGNQIFDGRVRETAVSNFIEVEALAYDPTIYSNLVSPNSSSAPTPGVFLVPPLFAMMDLPLINGDETPEAGYIAVFSNPFQGVDIFRSPETTGFTLNINITSPGTLGESQTDLFSGPTAVFDRGNTLRIKIFPNDVTLSSVSDLALFDGANKLAIQNADGGWEIIQFQNVSLISPGVYDLTNLLRGLHGTEDQLRDPVASGAKIVLLDGSQNEVDMNSNDIGLQYNWKIAPVGASLDNFVVQDVSHTFIGRGLMPFSPVHVKGSRNGAGDLTITWIRRTRFGGDTWIGGTPLNEEIEEYQVDILDGSTVVRTLTVNTPEATYTAAEQTTDFGSTQSSVSVNIYQMSAIVGRGVPRSATV